MRVDLLIDNLGSGGAQRQLVELSRVLREVPGVDARILVYRDVSSRDADLHGQRITTASVPVVAVIKRHRFDPLYPALLARELAGSDVVQSYMPIPSLWTCAALRLLRSTERPCWIACERTDPAHSSWTQRRIRALAFRHADAITVNSRSATSELERRFGIPHEQLHYIPNGIDLVGWDEASSRPPPWPMASDRFHIVLAGRLSREKNHSLLLEAIARLDPRLRANWTVWFLGASTREPDGERNVREAVGRFGLQEVVEIRPPTSGLAAFLAHVDLLVLPSRYEGFPNVVLEAMAARTIVVAAPVGDVPVLVEDGRTGFSFRPEDPQDLARVLARVHALAPTERKSIIEAARLRVETDFRIEKIAERHLALYDVLLRSRSGAHAA